MRTVAAVAGIAVLALAAPASALATFPGADGLIAFNQDDNNRAVYTTTPAGKKEHRLLNKAGDGSWSPSGKRIVFERFVPNNSQNSEIFIARADGSHAKRLTRMPSHETEPAFSPDGRRIVFASDADGDNDIHLINRNGTGLRRLTDLPREDQHPSWSVSGEIVFEGQVVDPAIGTFPVEHIFRFDPSTSDPPTDLGIGAEPDWSPDGQTITFVGRATQVLPNGTASLGLGAIWIMNREGAGRVQLYPQDPHGQTFDPTFSPSGGSIAAGEQISSFKVTTLYRFDLATGQRTNLAGAAFLLDETDPSWQPHRVGFARFRF